MGHRQRDAIMFCSSIFSGLSWILIVTAALGSAARAGPQPAPNAGNQIEVPVPAVPTLAPGFSYRQTNFVSDWPGIAPIQDQLLVNPWGIAATATSPFWVANDGTATSTLYRGDVSGSPFVKQPSMPFISITGSLPTGVVANTTSDFVITSGSASGPARFIFCSLTGYITGWNPNVPAAGSITAQIAATHPGNVYTGLAIGSSGGQNYLYAADLSNKKIDVYDKNYAIVSLTGNFTDPTLPADYGPFNIQNLGGTLYVAYAKVDPVTGDEVAGPGNGYVSKFNTNGTFVGRLISNGPLNAPWGLAITPASFGAFPNALLVGNFGGGAGSINAFNPTTGVFLGALRDESGTDIEIDGLWALTFGNGGAGGDPGTLYFTAGIGEEEHGLLGSLKPTTATATSLIQLASANFTVGEGTGHIDITVTRAGDVSGTASVNYATFDLSQPAHASQKSDYELALGKLTFAPGETSKTFRILVVDDQFVEGDEEIDVILSNPTGAGVGLGSPNKGKVTITDNDSVPSTTNPIDGSAFFVRQLYLDFLNREPEPAAFNFFVSQLTACGTDSTCMSARRANVATAFFTSAEFHQSGFLIYLANKAAFGNLGLVGAPGIPVLYGQLLRDLQIINQGVPFGTPGWETQLALNQQGFFADFVLRPAFVGLYATTMTPAEFVDALYAKASVGPGSLERQAAIDEFGGAGNTADSSARARALKRVTQNATFMRNEFNKAFVAFEFFALFRRDPDTAQFNTHVSTLNSFNGDFRAAGLINTFLSANEYRQRFGNGGPPSGSGPTPTPGSQSLNISTRGRVAPGEGVLIAGFIINGSGSKNVVLRAIGPSLTSSGISDGLPDPVLELRAADGTLIVSNDDWKSNQAQVQATGLAPADDRESAIVRSLTPGVYTAIVMGKGAATGVALAEVYDIDSQPSSSALANISTRGSVQTQNNVLIGGFQLGGSSGGSLILARGIGPSLQNFGVNSPLADPTIELHDSNGVTLAANNDWRDTQELEILYFGLPPANDLEAAILGARPPGPTTVIVAGRNGVTGIGLVEIFNFR
jgi:uncharacterized protein (TIGR03118 family)